MRPYPFPQMFDPGWVAGAVGAGRIHSVVATLGDGIVGTVSASFNVGGQGDGVAEGFGLVVRRATHRRGVGKGLVEYLLGAFRSKARVVLVEVRTAEPGAWQIVRDVGFTPVGFEPWAHYMPVGYEPMLVAAMLPDGALQADRSGLVTTPAVCRLAGAVVSPAGGTISATPGCHAKPREAIGPIVAARNDDTGRSLFAAPPVSAARSGVVGLQWFEGIDPRGNRFEEAFVVGEASGRVVAAVRVVLDRLDRRARLAGLVTTLDGVDAAVIGAARDVLLAPGPARPLAVVLDVAAADVGLQGAVEALGFVPSAYYPHLVAAPGGWSDVVQYTLGSGGNLGDVRRSLSPIAWPEAQRVIDAVTVAWDGRAGAGRPNDTFGSRTVSYDPPRHRGVGCRRDC